MNKLLFAFLLALQASAFAGAGVECIVPSKPGGAMDLTCKLAQAGLGEDMRLTYLPGGIGAVAWHSIVSQRRAEPNTLVVFSGGSLLNLAQGKFGKATPSDVRWVAALGADYGMIAVRADSPFRTLGDLMAALKANPAKVLIGVSGTIGSQDWLKMALLARIAGVDPKALRFVALEGGGEAFTAMHANYVQVVSGDASEATLYSAGGKSRVLAVLSEQRLPVCWRRCRPRASRASTWSGLSSAACGWDPTCRTPTTGAGSATSSATSTRRSSRACAPPTACTRSR
jgi:putative tricarboxylic transport membrane protein